MALVYVDPEDMIHPLRKTMSAEDLALVLQGIAEGQDWMTLEEIEAATDFLYDNIVAEKQTVLGEITLH